MRSGFIRLCLSSIVIAASPIARAQETVDVAKITCDQFLSGRVSDSRTITVWLSGYYHGTRKNTLVDVNAVQTEAQGIMDYCITHRDTILMDAVTTLFGNKK